MARVVTRKSSPPYLLIVFVFLFLIAAVLAVIQCTDNGKLTKDVADAKSTYQKLANAETLRDPRVVEMKSGKDETIVQQLLTQTSDLTKVIAGGALTKDDAMAKAAAAAKKASDTLDRSSKNQAPPGLAVDVQDLCDKIADLAKQKSAVDAQLTAKESALKSQTEAVDEVRNAFEKKLAAVEAQIVAQDKKFEDYRKEKEAELAKAIDEKQKSLDEKDKSLAEVTGKFQEMQLTIQRLQQENTNLKEENYQLKHPSGGPLAQRPAGKIERVVEGSDICYINIGSKDRVVGDLTFTVYPSTGITDNSDGKGSIIVTNVYENMSECRILRRIHGETIAPGDLLCNIAFSSTQTLTFLVIGDFDLSGKGAPTAAGRDEIKALLKKFGAKVAEEMSSSVDFVVSGEEPARPAKPSSEAPDPVKAVYDAQMKVLEQIRSIKVQAQDMRIPVLNANRFLTLIGSTPPPAPKAER